MQATASTTALSPNSAVMDRTRELCQSILDLPDYKEYVEQIEAFLADDAAKEVYRGYAEKGEEMHKKQHAGVLSDADIAQFEALQEEISENKLVAGFMSAQDALNEIHRTISTHVAKTLELGRLPEAEDLESGGCCGGGGCGCG